MPTPILMPALSPTMTEGNLAKWHKKEGDTVSSGDVIAEIETDKATMEVEAVDEGTLAKILVNEGTEGVSVNALIAVLTDEGEDIASVDIASLQADAPTTSTPEQNDTPVVAASAAPAPIAIQPTPPGPVASGGRVFASPLAKRLAKEKGIDLSQVTGSGPKGRIIKRDIESYQSSASGSAGIAASTGSRSADGLPAFEEIKTSNIRKVVAQRLQESKQQVPHFYLTVEMELDNLLTTRKSLNTKLEKQGVKVSVNDFIIKACAMALMEVPEANAMWMGDHIRQYKSADISVAVAMPDGLITPVIEDAQAKGLAQISMQMKDLATRAREGKLAPREFQGGTFTISNLGMFGIDEFSAIINPPQGCILAVGQGKQNPVVKNGELAIATVMKGTLSVDHRVVDGAVGAQFLAALKEYIQDPALMLV